ncbi:hypothetical protein J7W08_06040 [Methanococcoides orientis]|uniref:hypothetical protein n=1 Tax=Methanococcoides orientis TaxID=2822137 RepID=UPI001E63B63E|nr:hypothetical protein [Methanococcoides orientis]UGV39703.1 hypothetical protein J7W08_06040 [Methanococcoides orientis]
MIAEEKLEKLAKACEECIGEDSGSIDDHFEKCPVCKLYKEQAETVYCITETIKNIASKSEEERCDAICKNLDEFYGMPDDERLEAISEMLDAEGGLSEEDMFKIVTTRIDLLTKLPKEKRVLLIETLEKVMSQWPEDRKMLEKRAIMNATQDYFLLKKTLLRRMFKKMLS